MYMYYIAEVAYRVFPACSHKVIVLQVPVVGDSIFCHIMLIGLYLIAQRSIGIWKTGRYKGLRGSILTTQCGENRTRYMHSQPTQANLVWPDPGTSRGEKWGKVKGGGGKVRRVCWT